MTASELQYTFGPLLREWRQRRKLSQLELANRADTSARHISFIETGRSLPSRNLLLRLADRLDVPVRQRNALLVAAGYAPIYEETPIDAPNMTAVKTAVGRLLGAHEPYPAIAVNADENIVTMNRGVEPLLRMVSPALLTPPINVMRLALHPGGLIPHVINAAEWREHLLGRLRRQMAHSERASLRELYEEISRYPHQDTAPVQDAAAGVVAVVHLRMLGTELRLFSTITRFGATTDITVAELSLETFHPADEHTAAVLKRAAADLA